MRRKYLYMNTDKEKPTLGVTPKYLHDEQRKYELVKAIINRANNLQSIPKEWVDEYNNLEVKK